MIRLGDREEMGVGVRMLVRVTRQRLEVRSYGRRPGLGIQGSFVEEALSEDAQRRETLTRIIPPNEGAGPQLAQWARTLEDQIPLGLGACPQLGRSPGHHEVESGNLYPPLAAPGFLGQDRLPQRSAESSGARARLCQCGD